MNLKDQSVNSICFSKDRKKVLLINPKYSDSIWTSYLNPGIGHIAESLEQNNIEYDFFDLNLYSYEKLIKKIKKFNPDFLCVSLMTYDYMNNYKLINALKKRFPNKLTIIGGPHVSLFREKIMPECKGTDILVIGEGENTLVKIAKEEPLEKINNLIFLLLFLM